MSKPSRRLECSTTFPGSDLRTDWEEYRSEGETLDTHGWTEADFATFVRKTNKVLRDAGDGMRIRSVAFDRSYE